MNIKFPAKIRIICEKSKEYFKVVDFERSQCPFLKKVDSVLYVYCLKFTLYLELVD